MRIILCKGDEWQIKALDVVVITDGYDNNRIQRCAGMCRTGLGVLSAGTIPIKVIGLVDCGAGR